MILAAGFHFPDIGLHIFLRNVCVENVIISRRRLKTDVRMKQNVDTSSYDLLEEIRKVFIIIIYIYNNL